MFFNITKEESGNYTCKAEGKGINEIVTLIVKVKGKLQNLTISNLKIREIRVKSMNQNLFSDFQIIK